MNIHTSVRKCGQIRSHPNQVGLGYVMLCYVMLGVVRLS